MKKKQAILKKCQLFCEIDDSELTTLLNCLSPTINNFEKNSYVFMAGDSVTNVGVVLSGVVHILQDDFWGNRRILSHVEPGGLFGEALSCAEVDRVSVAVMAARKSEILLLDYRKIMGICSSACRFHNGLIRNMIRILAKTNVRLTQKIEYLTRTTTREKLLSYLSAEARQIDSHSFDIPFNRQELADYLSVDRSAMSKELSKMQNDGILVFRKNHFELK